MSKPPKLLRGWRRLYGDREPDLVPQARLSGPMPWVIAIMVALTVIAAAAGLALRNTARVTEAELSGGVTVQIVEADAAKRDKQAVAAVAKLRKIPGVIDVQRVPEAEIASLIEPWLGTEDLGNEDRATDGGEAIPVPALIDARLGHDVTPQRVAALQKALRGVAPAARVDAQSSWLEPVFDAIQSLQWFALALIALLAVAMVSAVLLASRTALGTNRETIEIVHLLGGTDAQIARTFQRSIGIDAAGGGAVGLALGYVVVMFLGRRFAGLGAGMVDGGALGWNDWLLLALVPVAGVVIAMITARITVLRSLREML